MPLEATPSREDVLDRRAHELELGVDGVLPRPRRICMLSLHACPLAAPGGKESGGMNVYVRELARQLARDRSIQGIALICCLTMGDIAELFSEEVCGRINHWVTFNTALSRAAQNNGWAQYQLMHLSDIPRQMRDYLKPTAALIRSSPTEGGRHVTFRAVPGQEGNMLSVWVNGVPALDVSVDGKQVNGAFARRAPDNTAWTLEYFNAPAAGAVVSMTLRGSRPLTVALAERAHGLPDLPGTSVTPRPASLEPIQSGDTTIVRRTYVF